jgi:hypothetical protein
MIAPTASPYIGTALPVSFGTMKLQGRLDTKIIGKRTNAEMRLNQPLFSIPYLAKSTAQVPRAVPAMTP